MFQQLARFFNGPSLISTIIKIIAQRRTTVIVTAAVYWGFGSKLPAYAMTSLLNLPAPGRCQSIYIPFTG